MSFPESPSGSPRIVQTADIADDAVTSDKIADGAINPAEIAANAVTTVKINNEAVTSEKLGIESVTASKPAGGVFMKSVDYPKESVGVLTLLALAGFDRAVTISAKATESFVAGAGAEPTFKIGETDADDKFAPTTAFAGISADPEAQVFCGILSAGKALIVTATAATVDATGALNITATAFRNAPA